MNRQLILLTLGLILTIPVFQSPIFSRYFKPLPGLHIVKNLPLNMVAGSTYEMEVCFRNPKRETFRMNVTLEITEEQFPMGSDEFFVTGILYARETPPPEEYCDDLIFDEVNVGIFFNSKEIVHGKTHNYLTIKISSVPNLMPDTYTFTLTVTLQYKT
jgi:hypothetical protein